MREIKFRLWHRKNKGMYAHNFMWGSPSLHGGGYVRCVPFGDGLRHDFMGYGNEIQIEPQECEIMQFTGLHDKNGKEIYEGDVVEYQYMSGFECSDDDYQKLGIGSRGVVTFVDGEFTPREHYCEVEDGYYSWRRFNFQVIGNIYENGDLLT